MLGRDEERPLLGSEAASTVMSSRSDGIGVAVHNTDLVVHGGWCAHKIWTLSLPSLEWAERQTGGVIPAARVFHTLTSWDADHVAVIGGEPLAANAPPEPLLPVFVLNMKSLRWDRLELAGEAPMNRSHHSAVNVKGAVIVFGGRPITQHRLTNSALNRLTADGFYDVFVLPRGSVSWQRIQVNQPIVPLLWGHTASHYAGPAADYVVFFGGVATRPTVDVHDDEPPLADFSNRVYVLNVSTLQWAAIEPRAASVVPPPRTLHCAHIFGRRLVVFGGVGFREGDSIDSAQPAPLNDSWQWDVETGEWLRLPAFALDSWASGRLLSGVYDGQLVVANDMLRLHFSSFAEGFHRWTTVACGMENANFVRKSPIDAVNTTPGRSAPLPTSSSEFMLRQQQLQAAARLGTPTANPTDGIDVRMLRDEVLRLQTQLGAARASPPPPPPPVLSPSSSPQTSPNFYAQVASPWPPKAVVPFTDEMRRSPSGSRMGASPAPYPNHAYAAFAAPRASPSSPISSPIVVHVRPVVRDIVEKTLGPNAFRHAPRQASPPRAASPPSRPQQPTTRRDDDIPDSIVAFRRLREQRTAAQRRQVSRIGALEEKLRSIKSETVPLPPPGEESAEYLSRSLPSRRRVTSPTSPAGTSLLRRSINSRLDGPFYDQDELSMLPSGRRRGDF